MYMYVSVRRRPSGTHQSRTHKVSPALTRSHVGQNTANEYTHGGGGGERGAALMIPRVRGVRAARAEGWGRVLLKQAVPRGTLSNACAASAAWALSTWPLCCRLGWDGVTYMLHVVIPGAVCCHSCPQSLLLWAGLGPWPFQVLGTGL